MLDSSFDRETSDKVIESLKHAQSFILIWAMKYPLKVRGQFGLMVRGDSC